MVLNEKPAVVCMKRMQALGAQIGYGGGGCDELNIVTR